MKINYSPKNNPRVIIIQKLYSYLINNEKLIDFPKHRFKKFIREVNILRQFVNKYAPGIITRKPKSYI